MYQNKLRGIEFPKSDMNVTRKPTRDHFKSFKKIVQPRYGKILLPIRAIPLPYLAVPLLRQHAPLPQGVM